MAASADRPGFIMASASNPFGVDRPLLRLMASAGVDHPADVDRLSETQLNRVLEGKTLPQRFALKERLRAAGLYPRTLPVAASMPVPW